MPQSNLHIQVGNQHLEFISRYKENHALESETIVVQRALELLEQSELETAYQQMAADQTRETDALEWAEATIQ
jgi:transposase